MKTDAEYAAVVNELESVLRELGRIKEHSLYMKGVGSVYDDPLLIEYLGYLARQRELIVPQKCKPILKLVE